MELHICAICAKEITSGRVAFAEVVDNAPVSFAHGQCWDDSGREPIGVVVLRSDEVSGDAPQSAGN
jgi:hypothetical protein